METGELYLGRKVLYTEKFPAEGTFKAYWAAEERLKDLGYSIGSMCRDEPIGFADGSKYSYIAKWYNISKEDKKKLDGVLISSDFREGGAQILWFNPPMF
jgi:hypothetical protein